MLPSTSLRVASGLFAVYAVMHTLGGVVAHVPLPGPPAEVFAAMKHTEFELGGVRDRSYRGFYVGFGLFVTLYLVFSAAFCWEWANIEYAYETNGRLDGRSRIPTVLVGWFFATHLLGLGLIYVYFFLPPAIFTVIILMLMGHATWRGGMVFDGERVMKKGA